MKPGDIDAALRRIISEARGVTGDLGAGESGRMLGACVALLATIVGEQEKRLRVLEPCPGQRYPAHHAWTEVSPERYMCGYCGMHQPT